jgi:hypothetical protein
LIKFNPNKTVAKHYSSNKNDALDICGLQIGKFGRVVRIRKMLVSIKYAVLSTKYYIVQVDGMHLNVSNM